MHHRFSTAVDAFTDVLFSHKTSQRLFSERGLTQIYHPKTDNLTASGGIGYEKGSWRLETSLSYSNGQTDFYPSYFPARPTQPNGSRSLDNGFAVMLAEVKADGAVFQLPAGMLRAAVGVSYRDEDFSSILLFPAPEDRTFRRNVGAAFGEIYVPLIGADNRRSGIERLDLSAAVRYDDYSDFGGTTNPRIGVLWSPMRNLSLRSSYSTSFRAPVAWEHMATSDSQMIILLPGVILPQPEGTTDPVLLLCCSKEALGPETSTNYTFGLDYAPQSLPKTKFSVNYYRIDFRDRIFKPAFDASALLRPDVYGSLVTRFANDAEAQTFVDGLLASGYSVFDPVGLGTDALNADPPAVAADRNSIRYDASNADPLGRFISLELRKVWGQR